MDDAWMARKSSAIRKRVGNSSVWSWNYQVRNANGRKSMWAYLPPLHDINMLINVETSTKITAELSMPSIVDHVNCETLLMLIKICAATTVAGLQCLGC